MTTTLNKIRDHSPCKDGWKRLLKYLNKTEEDDEELKIETIIKSNGVDDAIWCLSTVDGYDKEIHLFAIFCARQVQHLMKDSRSIKALDVAEDYINGKVTREELVEADYAAYDANDYAAAAYAARAATANASANAAYDAAIDATNAYAAYYAADYAANAYAAYCTATYDADDGKELMRKIQSKELLRICSLKEFVD